MSRTDWGPSIFFLACAIALAPACAAPGGPTPMACVGDEGCGPTARCNGYACVENQPPVADFSTAGDLVASAEVTLDASASRDPDPGDSISSYAWEVSSSDAECPLPTLTATTKTATLRFGCAGHYDVQLVVFDEMQLESAPRVRTLTVADRTGPAIVVAGPDQTVGHTCGGSPIRCTTSAEVQLGATLDSAASLTVRWSVQPPAGLPLDETRRVRFEPSATSLNPKVVIETDGTAISTDWDFRVEALNGADVLASDVTRVSVTNRPPTVTVGAVTAQPHSYQRESQFFVVNGSIPAEVDDPDGDPLEWTTLVSHTGDGDSTFQATYNGSAIGISVTVAGAHPEWLIGGAGLTRNVTLRVADANGAAADPVTVPVTVGNKLPTGSYPSSSTTPHSFDAAWTRYVAEPSLGTYVDPEGDPLDHQVTMTDVSAADCPTSTLEPDGLLTLSCERTWTSSGDLAAFIAPRSAQIEVSDPWGSRRWAVSFRIGNRPPTASGTLTASPGVSCTPFGGTTYCGNGGSGSPPRANVFAALTTSYPIAGLSDPDGDPLLVAPVAGAATGSSCSGVLACRLGYTLPQTEYCTSSPPSTSIPFTVTDGASAVSLSLSVQPRCN